MPVTAPLRHPLAAPRTPPGFHFLLQNHLDDLPHALSNRCFQPLAQRTLLAHFHCSASLRHGVFLLCSEPPAKRFRAFSFTDFSGEYAFYFSTGMGTEPSSHCTSRDSSKQKWRAGFRERLSATCFWS